RCESRRTEISIDDGRRGQRLVPSCWLCSDADDLRQVIEVPVSRVQGDVVLQDESRQPHIVRRNRCPLLTELTEDRRIVVSGLVVGEEHVYAILQQEPPEDSLVLGLPASVSEAGSKLANDDEWQQNRLCFLQE